MKCFNIRTRFCIKQSKQSTLSVSPTPKFGSYQSENFYYLKVVAFHMRIVPSSEAVIMMPSSG